MLYLFYLYYYDVIKYFKRKYLCIIKIIYFFIIKIRFLNKMINSDCIFEEKIYGLVLCLIC